MGTRKTPSNGKGNKPAFFKRVSNVFFCFLPGQMKKSLQSSSKETVRHLTLMSWRRSSKFYQITLRSVTSIKILILSALSLCFQADKLWEQRIWSIREDFALSLPCANPLSFLCTRCLSLIRTPGYINHLILRTKQTSVVQKLLKRYFDLRTGRVISCFSP